MTRTDTDNLPLKSYPCPSVLSVAKHNFRAGEVLVVGAWSVCSKTRNSNSAWAMTKAVVIRDCCDIYCCVLFRIIFCNGRGCRCQKKAALTPCRSVIPVLRMNVYYQDRNVLATFCHCCTKHKRMARRGLDLATMHRCKWTL